MDPQDVVVQLDFEVLENQRKVLGQRLSTVSPHPD
jgi:hypothetical protein